MPRPKSPSGAISDRCTSVCLLRRSSARSRPSPYDAADDRPPTLVPASGAPASRRPSRRSRASRLLICSPTPRPDSRSAPRSRSSASTSRTGSSCARWNVRAVLAGWACSEGDRVGLLLPNSPQYVIAWYACQRLGAIAVGNNPLYTQRELAHQIKDFAPSVMIVLDQLYPAWAAVAARGRRARGHRHRAHRLHEVPAQRARAAQVPEGREARGQALAAGPVRRARPVVEGLVGAAGAPPPVAQVDAETDAATLVYTGGTTGLSKGAMLSHHNLSANVAAGRAVHHRSSSAAGTA